MLAGVVTVDPEVPLPGAPDPWVSSSMPELRPAPPYLMTEMIAAEPAVGERIARRMATDPVAADAALAVLRAAERGEPVVTTGCGTSEHAAMGGAELLSDAIGSERAHLVRARQALDLVRTPQAAGVVIAVSHEGGTWATNEAIGACRLAGARTVLITVSGRSPGARAAELVIETFEQDQSWCHTVGYLSPLVALAALAAAVRGDRLDPTALRAMLEIAVDEAAAEQAAQALVASERLLVAGAGLDLVSARELALKVEEGAGLPATALHTETVLHGHLAAAGSRTGLVLVLTDASAMGEPVRERSRATLRAARRLEMPAVAILGAGIGPGLPIELTPGGRLAAPEANRLHSSAEAVLGTAIPLQLFAERLARARNRNPDPIGRDEPRHAAAAEA